MPIHQGHVVDQISNVIHVTVTVSDHAIGYIKSQVCLILFVI